MMSNPELICPNAAAPSYDENSVPVDLVAGQSGTAIIQLHHHEEGTAALEKQIAQTGTATIYGTHFDTDSAKLRPDSLRARGWRHKASALLVP